MPIYVNDIFIATYVITPLIITVNDRHTSFRETIMTFYISNTKNDFQKANKFKSRAKKDITKEKR